MQSEGVPSAEEFDRKLAETDAYLQILINQVENLERRIEACEDVAMKEKYNVIKVTANAMIEAIKHSIMMLQISKVGWLFVECWLLWKKILLQLTLHSIDTHFYAISNRQLLKTLWEKEKLLVTSNFSFSHNVFYSIR